MQSSAESAVATAQPYAEHPLAHAIALYNAGNIQESEAAFKEFIGSPQYGEDAYYWLGLIRLKQGNLNEAHVMLQHALALDPNNANVLSLLGTLAESRHAFDEARSYYSRALAINPNLSSTRERLTALAQVPSGAAPKRRGWLGRVGNILILVIFLGWLFFSYSLPMGFRLHDIVTGVATLIAARAFIGLFPTRQH